MGEGTGWAYEQASELTGELCTLADKLETAIDAEDADEVKGIIEALQSKLKALKAEVSDIPISADVAE